MSPTLPGGPDADRSQTGPLGMALVFTIVMVGIAVVVVTSSGAITQTQDRISIERAEKTLTQMDSEMAKVALGGTGSGSIDLGSDGETYTVDGGAGWIKVTRSSGSNPLPKTDLGAIVFERDRTRVAYQGGGVWKESPGGGTTMISPPEFHFRDGTLTLPLITLADGSDTLEGRTNIRQSGDPVQKFPVEGVSGKTNPVENAKVTVVVKSDYYEAWGRYFEERTEGDVVFDHPNDKVELVLEGQSGRQAITYGLGVPTAGGGGTVTLQGGSQIMIDSYSSDSISSSRSMSNPPSTAGDSDVEIQKSVFFKGAGEVTGDLTATGSVSFNGAPVERIHGDLHYGEGTVSSADCSAYVGAPTDSCTKDASLDPPDVMDPEISATISTVKNDNDNDDEPCLDTSGFDTTGCDPVTIEAGDYYLTNNFDPGQRDVTLDTTNGDITFAVDNDQNIEIDKTDIDVVGNGRVEIYGTKKIDIKGGSVKNEGWDAAQFWVYCDASCNVDLTNNPTFVGVVYAPTDPSAPNAGNAQFQIQGGSTEFWGAVIAGANGGVDIKNGADVHFDRALKNKKVLGGTSAIPISYLHISVNEVEVDN